MEKNIDNDYPSQYAKKRGYTTKQAKENYLRLTNGMKCHYIHYPIDKGSETTIVYLHGGSSCCDDWPEIIQFCKDKTIGFFACSLLTYGKSDGFDPTEENFLISSHVEQVKEQITYALRTFLQGQKIILIGMSFGGQLAVLSLRDEEFACMISG